MFKGREASSDYFSASLSPHTRSRPVQGPDRSADDAPARREPARLRPIQLERHQGDWRKRSQYNGSRRYHCFALIARYRLLLQVLTPPTLDQAIDQKPSHCEHPQGGLPTAARPTAVRRPTARSPGAGRPGGLLPSAPEGLSSTLYISVRITYSILRTFFEREG